MVQDPCSPRLTGARRVRTTWGRVVPLLGLLASIAVVLVGFRDIAVGGKTFDPSALLGGVNGGIPPTGVARPMVNDQYRVDPGASSWATLPWAHVVHNEYSQGRLPLWNPYQGSGTPLAGNAQSAAFDPLMLAVDLHPSLLVWDLSLLFAYVLASAATFLFLRNLGVSTLGAVTGAGAFALCGFYAIDSNNTFTRVYTYLPLILLGVDHVTRSRKLRWVVFLAAMIAGCCLAGMPESSFFVLGAAGAYAVYRLVSGPRATLRARTLRMAASGMLGLAFAAPLLVLVIQYLPLSFNVHPPGVGMGVASRVTLLNWLVPLVNGYPSKQFGTLVADRSWCGMAVASLILVAVSGGSSLRRRGSWVLLGIGVVTLVKIHGLPGVQWLGRLPVASRVNWVAFAPPVVSFCFAAVAGMGVHAIVTGSVRRGRLLVLVGVAAIGIAVFLRADWEVVRTITWVNEGRNFLVAGVVACVVVAAALLSPLVLSSPSRTGAFRQVLAGATALAVLTELLIFFPHGIYAPRQDPYRRPPWLALVAPAPAKQPTPRVIGLDGVLFPNTAGVLGLQDVRTLDALYVQRYITYIRDFVSSSFSDRFIGDGVTTTEIAGNPMFDLLGVRYVFAGSANVLASPAVATADGYNLLGSRDGIAVLENLHPAPRAFVVSGVHVVPDQGAAVSYLRSLGRMQPDGRSVLDGFDPESQAVVEGPQSAIGSLEADALPPGAPRRATAIVSYGPDRVVVHVGAGAPGLLVLTDTFYPGWRATVNGHSLAVRPADVTFRGVPVSSGETTVVFQYAPPQETLAWGLVALAVLALAGAWAVRRRWDRPDRAPIDPASELAGPSGD